MSNTKFKLSKRSLERMQPLHPDMVKVVKRAIEITPFDFGVGEVLRDIKTQEDNIAKGVSTTMNTLHFRQMDGWVHAVDLVVYVDGEVTWDVGYYRKVIQAMFTAAIEEGVQIKAGGLWRTLVDGPHFELNRKYY